MRRIKLLVAVVTAMTMLVSMSAPAMADNWDEHYDDDFDGHHNLFINDFDDFEDFDEDYVELDDCELVRYYGDDEAVFVCEVDFD